MFFIRLNPALVYSIVGVLTLAHVSLVMAFQSSSPPAILRSLFYLNEFGSFAHWLTAVLACNLAVQAVYAGANQSVRRRYLIALVLLLISLCEISEIHHHFSVPGLNSALGFTPKDAWLPAWGLLSLVGLLLFGFCYNDATVYPWHLLTAGIVFWIGSTGVATAASLLGETDKATTQYLLCIGVGRTLELLGLAIASHAFYGISRR